jgi:hypothetical protein
MASDPAAGDYQRPPIWRDSRVSGFEFWQHNSATACFPRERMVSQNSEQDGGGQPATRPEST